MSETVFGRSYSLRSEFSGEFSSHESQNSPEIERQFKESLRQEPIQRLIKMWERVDTNNNKPNLKFKKQNSVAISFLEKVISDQKDLIFNRKLKFKVYEFLHRPHSWLGYCYHLFVFFIVFMCLIVTIFTTIRKFESLFWNIMIAMEKVIIIWFTGEFLIRIWASSCRLQYRGWIGKLRYMCSPSHFIDLIVIIVSITVMWIQKGVTEEGNMVFAASAFRGFHRFFQVIRITRTERRFTPFRILLSVLYSQREQLIIITYIAFLVLSSAAFLLYLTEKGTNEQFESIADSFWWAVVTLFTIGYGDKVPMTWLGKILAAVFIIFGVMIFTIPAGILGAGLAINIQRQEKHFKNKQKLIPAAVLIQSSWRDLSVSAWNKPQRNNSFPMIERNAIKFIRSIMFLRAVRTFKTLFIRKEIKDVIEQNRTDHLNIIFTIKELKTNMNKIQNNYDLSLNSTSNQLKDKIKELEVMNQILMDRFDKQSECFDNLFRVLSDKHIE